VLLTVTWRHATAYHYHFVESHRLRCTLSRFARKAVQAIRNRSFSSGNKYCPWTQLRHLSHIDCKTEAKPRVGKPLQGGVQGYSTGWAVDASSVTYFSLPTFRNLAGPPPCVNYLVREEYANRLQSVVTCAGYLRCAQRADFESLNGLQGRDGASEVANLRIKFRSTGGAGKPTARETKKKTADLWPLRASSAL
jgi:hypothetical protein